MTGLVSPRQQRGPLLGDAVEVVCFQQHDASPGNPVDRPDVGFEQRFADGGRDFAPDRNLCVAADTADFFGRAFAVAVRRIQGFVYGRDRRMVFAAGEIVRQHPRHRNLAFGGFGQRNADRVAEPVGQQRADARSRLDPSFAVVARFGDAQVQRIAHLLGAHGRRQHPVGLHHHADVARFDR